MIVLSEARGRGVGRALIEHVEAVSIGQDIHTIRLETGPLSHKALSLYRLNGY